MCDMWEWSGKLSLPSPPFLHQSLFNPLQPSLITTCTMTYTQGYLYLTTAMGWYPTADTYSTAIQLQIEAVNSIAY